MYLAMYKKLSSSSGTGAVAKRFMDEDGSVAIAMDDNAAGEDGSEKCLRVEEPVDGTLVRRKPSGLGAERAWRRGLTGLECKAGT